MRVDRADDLAMQAAQIACDVVLQPPLRSFGRNLRVPSVGRGPHDVAAIRHCRPQSTKKYENHAGNQQNET
jgi:hypothetical protein